MDISDDPVAAQYDYHPYGSQHTNAELAASGNDYRLGGKERQERFGVPYYDFGARLYDGIEWCSSDVLSEKFRSIGPYVYCGGNPINRIDRDGNIWVDAQGRILFKNGKWTKAANQFDKQLGNELRKTPTGLEMFNFLVDSPIPTVVESGFLRKGSYGENRLYTKANGTIARIKITLDCENLKEKAKDHKVTLMQAAASTLGHEVRHGHPDNIKMQVKTQQMNPKQEYEESPEEKDARAIGDQILNEYRNNIKPEENEKGNFSAFWNSVRAFVRQLFE